MKPSHAVSESERNFDKVFQEWIDNNIQEQGYPPKSAPSVVKGRALLDVYINEIGKFVYKIDDDQIEQGLELDEPNDLGVDFIFDRENDYYVIQSKYREGKKGKKRKPTTDEISNFLKIPKRFLDQDYVQNMEIKR